MPRKGRRQPDSFTVIVVPHSEKASFSVRVPFAAIYVSLGLLLVAIASVAYLVFDYQGMAGQVAELRRSGQVEIVRQQDLRTTIVAERQQQQVLRALIDQQNAQAVAWERERQEEAALFNQEVGRLYAQIEELEQFKADIRRLVGLDKATPVPSTSPKAQDSSPAAIGPLEPLGNERVAANLSNRGSGRPAETTEDAINTTTTLLDHTIPQQMAELEALRQQVADRVSRVDGGWSSPEELSSQLSLYDASPRAWPIQGLIMARYGYDSRRLDLGAQPFHKGVDIGAPVGAAVRAPQDGVVVSAGWNGSYGLTLELRHTMGWSTLYAHLSSIPVKVGQKVKQGDIIGYIGMTGLTTGPHLHYEIHLNGTPIDPAKYLGK